MILKCSCGSTEFEIFGDYIWNIMCVDCHKLRGQTPLSTIGYPAEDWDKWKEEKGVLKKQ